jgi:amidase
MTAPAAIDPFTSASDMLAMLDARQVSSAELVEMHIERIERLNAPINAIIIRTFERARASAAEADRRRALGETGALLGLPFTLKESNEVAGLPCTAGMEVFRDHVPAADGPLPAATFAAGAALLGKTNIPAALADWQSDSPIYGRTNNPYDLGRSPGGSTGGGAAALAAGLTPLEFGSDIGGSTRVPATFCGVYGLRPSETAVPRTGSFPMSALPNVTAVLAVQGPLARTAADLELGLDAVSGPEVGEDVGWKLTIPRARAESLRGLRVAVLPAIDWVPVDGEILAAQETLAGALSRAGATVKVVGPDGIEIESYYNDYNRGLLARTTAGQPREAREAQAAAARAGDPRFGPAIADGLTLSFTDFASLMDRRERARAAFRAFFRDWDILLSPMTLTAAFPHEERVFHTRTIAVNGREVSYRLQLVYPSLATFAGQPAVAFPVGLNRAGLPIGLQAIGPYLEDRTPIRFAQLVERERGGFVRPPGF